jgi:hypothetical protein
MISKMRYGNGIFMQGELASHCHTMSSPRTRRFPLLGAGSACLLSAGFDDEIGPGPSQPHSLSGLAGVLHSSHDSASDLHVHRSVFKVGTRAVNRLFLSLWFALIWALWPSNDWICLVVVMQAFFASVRLLQAPTLAPQPADSASEPAMGKGNGELRA